MCPSCRALLLPSARDSCNSQSWDAWHMDKEHKSHGYPPHCPKEHCQHLSSHEKTRYCLFLQSEQKQGHLASVKGIPGMLKFLWFFAFSFSRKTSTADI